MKMTLKTLPSAVGKLDAQMVDDEPDSQPVEYEEENRNTVSMAPIAKTVAGPKQIVSALRSRTRQSKAASGPR